ncbi:hypothetical protein FV140_12995 [Paenarthrobacter ureafaciens]|uniref:hypothetical protein n=1 Tax=Paenarthrobacter ureafaciens TaxID=37931 RepID=UPI0015F49099|nr:hypothetical protein [Paenarthrobacter ureafaciens]QMU82917.1 hypothetical protein FV140_12995 [Paenarthrobacter ureafaciens]
MASTKIDESGVRADKPVRKTRFVAAPDAGAAPGDAEPTGDGNVPGALMSRRAAIGGVGMGAAALLCFVVGAGLSGGEAAVSHDKAQQIVSLREQIRTAQVHADALPEAMDADRALVTAQGAAEQIARLQNEYRHLTPSVTGAGGTLDQTAAEPTRRNLTPYFVPDVGQAALQPWYLLASDKAVPAGNEIPMSFDSGFEWVAQRPYSVEVGGTIRVTWLALQTRPAAGQAPGCWPGHAPTTT